MIYIKTMLTAEDQEANVAGKVKIFKVIQLMEEIQLILYVKIHMTGKIQAVQYRVWATTLVTVLVVDLEEVIKVIHKLSIVT